MSSPADRAQAVRAAGVVLLSMAAAALAASFVFALAGRHWNSAVVLGLVVIALAGGVYQLFRLYLSHSPRHRGRHANAQVPPLAAKRRRPRHLP
jgi:apolipoprotein N-acyltransferase